MGGGRNSDPHCNCQKDPGSPPFSSPGPMHFSSATPAGQIFSLPERHAKSAQSPSATSSQLPTIRSLTALRRANGFFSTPPVKDSGRGTVRPQRAHEEPQGPFGHPGDGQTSAILFSNSTASPDARQKSCVPPKHSGPPPVQTTEILSRLLGQTVAPAQSRLSFRTVNSPTRLRLRQGADEQSGLPFPAPWKWRLGSLLRS